MMFFGKPSSSSGICQPPRVKSPETYWTKGVRSLAGDFHDSWNQWIGSANIYRKPFTYFMGKTMEKTSLKNRWRLRKPKKNDLSLIQSQGQLLILLEPFASQAGSICGEYLQFDLWMSAKSDGKWSHKSIPDVFGNGFFVQSGGIEKFKSDSVWHTLAFYRELSWVMGVPHNLSSILDGQFRIFPEINHPHLWKPPYVSIIFHPFRLSGPQRHLLLGCCHTGCLRASQF